MVGYLKIFGYLWLGKYIFLTQNNFSSAPTLGKNNNRSLSIVEQQTVPRRDYTLPNLTTQKTRFE